MVSIKSWPQANDYLGKKDDRPLPGKATRLQRRPDGTIAVRYHNTDVVTYDINGTCTLRNGGWQSVTTKERMNEYSPATVGQEKGCWYIGRYWQGQPRSEFYDGMIIGIDGAAVEPRMGDGSARRHIDRQVSAYIREYVAALEAGKIGPPDLGDCWGCRFGMETGSHPMGYSHYLEHFTEPYYVPSILYRAVMAMAGDSPYALSLAFVNRDGDYAARALRSYFKRLKPHLYAEVTTPEAVA